MDEDDGLSPSSLDVLELRPIDVRGGHVFPQIADKWALPPTDIEQT